MKKLPLFFAYCALGLLALCYNNSSKAGVCFVVDGDCGNINARRPGGGDGPGSDPWGPKPCKELGFFRTISCTSDQITLETCRTGNTTYYRCKCKDDFKYINDNSTYEYKKSCTGTDNITKYKYKVCPSKYKYGSYNSVSSARTLFKSGVHNTLYEQEANTTLGGKSCVDKYDLNNTGTVTRWTQTSCNQQIYKYTKYTHDAFIQSGECKGSADTTARYSNMTCSNKTVGGGAYRASCYDNEKEIKTGSRTTIEEQSVTCKYCIPKTCSDYGYFTKPLPGYRVETKTANDETCYINSLCAVGDYVMTGGYCKTKTDYLSSDIEKALETKGSGSSKLLGVATKVTKANGYITLRVVARDEADSDSYRADIAGGNSLAKAYKAFSGDKTNWGLMNNEDVYAIATSEIYSNFNNIHNGRHNLFKVLVDEVDEDNSKKCVKTQRYAYADVYQCYWITHKDDSAVKRGVINGTLDNKIASTTNKWPMFSYGTHIYMRRSGQTDYEAGYNGKPAYQNYLWYSSNATGPKWGETGAGSAQVSFCGTTKGDNASSQWKERANSSKVTLEQILYGGRSGGTNYVPLTYGARYYSSGWPRGVQPWRIAVMYAGELSDSESKAGACRGSGNSFYCRMRMYWHGTAYICPYELEKNGSKEPTEKCFNVWESGKSNYYYVLARRYTNWNYEGKTLFNNNDHNGKNTLKKGGYSWDDATDFYKRGVQGCFTRAATELKVKDRSDEEAASAGEGNTSSSIDINADKSEILKKLLEESDQFDKAMGSMSDAERGFAYNEDIEFDYTDYADNFKEEEGSTTTTPNLRDLINSDKFKNKFALAKEIDRGLLLDNKKLEAGTITMK